MPGNGFAVNICSRLPPVLGVASRSISALGWQITNLEGAKLDLEQYKPKHTVQKWGWAVAIFSLFGVLTGITTGMLDLTVFYLVALGIGSYLVASPKPQEYFEKRSQDKAAAAESAIQSALRDLENATGVEAFIAYENLERLVDKAGPSYPKQLSELLASINFDHSRVESKYLGSLVNLNAGMFGHPERRTIRIYQQWVVAGDMGYDFDVSTRGSVTVDGSIQLDKNNNKVDMRTATMQLATQDWSHAFKILPDEADEARRILNQLAALVEEMKPKVLTAVDMKKAMEELLDSSAKSPAEKLEELSNLRYQRLLTDQEFEAAKTKILGI